jgi:phosphoribosylformylglycinamidine cyclo-ligase
MELGIRVNIGAWFEPDVFRRIQRAAAIDGPEMRATFNCGIGFAVVVQEEAADATIDILGREDIEAWAIGEVRPVSELGARYAEASST